MTNNVITYPYEHGTRIGYCLCVTQAQIERVKELNGRQDKSRSPVNIGANMDAVRIVDEDEPTVGMICGWWFGIYIGILPDGSAHS